MGFITIANNIIITVVKQNYLHQEKDGQELRNRRNLLPGLEWEAVRTTMLLNVF